MVRVLQRAMPTSERETESPIPNGRFGTRVIFQGFRGTDTGSGIRVWGSVRFWAAWSHSSNSNPVPPRDIRGAMEDGAEEAGGEEEEEVWGGSGLRVKV